jgi:hypothetical protein
MLSFKFTVEYIFNTYLTYKGFYIYIYIYIYIYNIYKFQREKRTERRSGLLVDIHCPIQLAISHLTSGKNSSRAGEVKLSDVFRSATVSNSFSPSAYLNPQLVRVSSQSSPHLPSHGRRKNTNSELNVSVQRKSRPRNSAGRRDQDSGN